MNKSAKLGSLLLLAGIASFLGLGFSDSLKAYPFPIAVFGAALMLFGAYLLTDPDAANQLERKNKSNSRH